jgi:hypothetical protein
MALRGPAPGDIYWALISHARGHSVQYTGFTVNNMMIKCRITRLSDVRRIIYYMRHPRVSGVVFRSRIVRRLVSGVNIKPSRDIG